MAKNSILFAAFIFVLILTSAPKMALAENPLCGMLDAIPVVGDVIKGIINCKVSDDKDIPDPSDDSGPIDKPPSR